jgi:hypothetical protein
MPNKWHMCKEGQDGNKKRQRHGLLVFFFLELPGLSSAGSRSGCFHTSLGNDKEMIQNRTAKIKKASYCFYFQ